MTHPFLYVAHCKLPSQVRVSAYLPSSSLSLTVTQIVEFESTVRNGWNGGTRTRRTGHGEGTLGIGQVQQAGIMRGGIGFTVAKAMGTRRSVCKEEFSS